MSPLIGQVLANNAVAMLTVGVGRRKRERQCEKKEESMKVVFIEREETNRKSHYTKFSPNNTNRGVGTC